MRLPMDTRVYEFLFRFNQNLDQALGSLDLLKSLSLTPTEYIDRVRIQLNEIRASANGQFTERICRQEQQEEGRFAAIRHRRDKQWESPNELYLELSSRERKRRQQGLPPRAVILPWSQTDDDNILAARRAIDDARTSQEPAASDEGQLGSSSQ
jgi:hypothetical protein